MRFFVTILAGSIIGIASYTSIARVATTFNRDLPSTRSKIYSLPILSIFSGKVLIHDEETKEITFKTSAQDLLSSRVIRFPYTKDTRWFKVIFDSNNGMVKESSVIPISPVKIEAGTEVRIDLDTIQKHIMNVYLFNI